MSAPCLGCGSTDSFMVTLGLSDGGELQHYSCDPCYQKAHAELTEARRQFDELIAAGVSREEANKMMIARLELEAVQ